MKYLFFTFLLLASLPALASESYFDVGDKLESIKSGGIEFGLDLPIDQQYTENFDPSIHARYFVLDDVSLGFYGRWSERAITNRYSIGPSIRAYFLVLGPVHFNISQTFAWTFARAKSSSDKSRYDDEYLQMVARVGLQIELGRGLALGYELNNHSLIKDGDNKGGFYESRINLYYHLNKKSPEKTTGVPRPKEISDERKKSAQYAFGSRSIGHLVSSNATTLNKGDKTFGTLYTGYGVSDSWTLVVSPFVYLLYDMASVMTRHGFDLSATERLAFEATYFKSLNPQNEVYLEEEASTKTGYTTFKMEATSLKLTYAKLLTPYYRASLTASYFYYFDEDRPFSLRMDPQNNDPFALSLTSLHEFRVANNFFISAELGAWGLNYHSPYYHAGLSINMQRKHIYLGIGASTTFNPSFTRDSVKKYASYDSRWSIHPELQAQLFF